MRTYPTVIASRVCSIQQRSRIQGPYRWNLVSKGIKANHIDITQITIRSGFTLSNKRFSCSTFGLYPQGARAHNRSIAVVIKLDK